jgi:hypothetical protein
MAPSSTRKNGGRKGVKRDGRTWWSSMWSDSLEFGARRGMCSARARVEPKAKPFFAPVKRVAPPTQDKRQVARSMMEG